VLAPVVTGGLLFLRWWLSEGQKKKRKRKRERKRIQELGKAYRDGDAGDVHDMFDDLL